MRFEITRISDCFFVVKAPDCPHIRPAEIHDVALQLQHDFNVDTRGIRFFWPDDDEIDVIVAKLREPPAQPQNKRGRRIAPAS